MLPESAFPALVLNADFQPLATVPLSVMCWHDAVKADVKETHVVLERYDQVVRSPRFEMRLPAVLALKQYVRQDKPAALTRWSLFLAHDFTCGYCGGVFDTTDLTFEHVHPKSRGGETSWMNLVPACEPCNLRKRNRTPKEAGMHLLRKPFHPSGDDLNRIGRAHVGKTSRIREEWRSWLYWSVELEPG